MFALLIELKRRGSLSLNESITFIYKNEKYYIINVDDMSILESSQRDLLNLLKENL